MPIWADRLDDSDTRTTLCNLGQFDHQLDEAQKPILEEFMDWLTRIEGTCLISSEDNQELARRIRIIAHRLGHALVCPRCGKLGSFDYSITKKPSGSSGTFQFRHREGGRSFRHSLKNRLPKLDIIKFNDLG